MISVQAGRLELMAGCLPALKPVFAVFPYYYRNPLSMIAAFHALHYWFKE